MKLKIKKGDIVRVLTGKDRSKTGKVLKIDKKANKVLVEGINMFKKHKKARKQGQKGEIVTLPRPLDYSNVALDAAVAKKKKA